MLHYTMGFVTRSYLILIIVVLVQLDQCDAAEPASELASCPIHSRLNFKNTAWVEAGGSDEPLQCTCRVLNSALTQTSVRWVDTDTPSEILTSGFPEARLNFTRTTETFKRFECRVISFGITYEKEDFKINYGYGPKEARIKITEITPTYHTMACEVTNSEVRPRMEAQFKIVEMNGSLSSFETVLTGTHIVTYKFFNKIGVFHAECITNNTQYRNIGAVATLKYTIDVSMTRISVYPANQSKFQMNAESGNSTMRIDCSILTEEESLSNGEVINLQIFNSSGAVIKVYDCSGNKTKEGNLTYFRCADFLPPKPDVYKAVCNGYNSFDPTQNRTTNSSIFVAYETPTLVFEDNCPNGYIKGQIDVNCTCNMTGNGIDLYYVKWAAIGSDLQVFKDNSSVLLEQPNIKFTSTLKRTCVAVLYFDDSEVTNSSITFHYAYGPTEMKAIVNSSTVLQSDTVPLTCFNIYGDAPHDKTNVSVFITDINDNGRQVFNAQCAEIPANMGPLVYHCGNWTAGNASRYNVTCSGVNGIYPEEFNASHTITMTVQALPIASLAGSCPMDSFAGTELTCSCEIITPGYPDPGQAFWYDDTGTFIISGNPANLTVTSAVVNSAGTKLYKCRAQSSVGDGDFIEYAAKLVFGPTIVTMRPLPSFILVNTSVSITLEIPESDFAPRDQMTAGCTVSNSSGGKSFIGECFEPAGPARKKRQAPNQVIFECSGWTPAVPDNYSILCEAQQRNFFSLRASDTKSVVIHALTTVALNGNCPTQYVKGTSVSCTCNVTEPGYPDAGEALWYANGLVVERGSTSATLTVTSTDYPSGMASFTCTGNSSAGLGNNVTFDAKFAYGPSAVTAIAITGAAPLTMDTVAVPIRCDVNGTARAPNHNTQLIIQNPDKAVISPTWNNQTGPMHEATFYYNLSKPAKVVAICVASNSIFPDMNVSSPVTFEVFGHSEIKLVNCPSPVIGSANGSCTCQVVKPGYPAGIPSWYNQNGEVVLTGPSPLVLKFDQNHINQNFTCQANSSFGTSQVLNYVVALVYGPSAIVPGIEYVKTAANEIMFYCKVNALLFAPNVTTDFRILEFSTGYDFKYRRLGPFSESIIDFYLLNTTNLRGTFTAECMANNTEERSFGATSRMPFNAEVAPTAKFVGCSMYENELPGTKTWVDVEEIISCQCELTDEGFPAGRVTAQWVDGVSGEVISEGHPSANLSYVRNDGDSSKIFKCQGNSTVGPSDVPSSFEIGYIYGPTSVSIVVPDTPTFNITTSTPPANVTVYCAIQTDYNPSVLVRLIATDKFGATLINVTEPDDVIPMHGVNVSRRSFSFPAPVDGLNQPALDMNIKCEAENKLNRSKSAKAEAMLDMPAVELINCPPNVNGTWSYDVGLSKRNANCTCRLSNRGVPAGQARWVDGDGNELVTSDTKAVLEVDTDDHRSLFKCQAMTLWSAVVEIVFQPIFSALPRPALVDCAPKSNLSGITWTVLGEPTNPVNCTCQLAEPGFPVNGSVAKWIDSLTGKVISQDSSRARLLYTRPEGEISRMFQCQAENSVGTSDFPIAYPIGFIRGPKSASIGFPVDPPSSVNTTSSTVANLTLYCAIPSDVSPSIHVEVDVLDPLGRLILNSNETVEITSVSNVTRFTFSFPPFLDAMLKPDLNFSILCKARNDISPGMTAEDNVTLAHPTLELSNCPPNNGGSTYDVRQREANCTCQLSNPGIPQGQVRWVDVGGNIVASGGLQAVLGVDFHGHNQTYICQALTLRTVVEEIAFTPIFTVLPVAEIANCFVYETLTRGEKTWITAGGSEDQFICGCNIKYVGIPDGGTMAQWVNRDTGKVISMHNQKAVLFHTRAEGDESKAFICRAVNVNGVSETNTTLDIHYAYGPSNASIGVLDNPPLDKNSSLPHTNVSVYCDVTYTNPTINVQLTGLNQSGVSVVNLTKPDDIISMANNVSRFVFRFSPPLDDRQRPNLNMTIKCKAENAIDPNVNATDELTLEMSTVKLTGCPPNIGGSIHQVELSKMTTNCTCQLLNAGLPQGNVRWVDGNGNSVTSGGLEATLGFNVSDHNRTFICQAMTLWFVVQEIPFTPIFSDLPSAAIANCPIYDARTKGDKIWVVAGGSDDPFACGCRLTNPGFPTKDSKAKWVDGDTGQLISEGSPVVDAGYTRAPGVSSKTFKCEAKNTIGSSLASTSFQVNYLYGPTEMSISALGTPKNDSIKNSQNPSKLHIFCDIPADVTPSVNVTVIGTNSTGDDFISMDKPDETMTMGNKSRWMFSFQAPVNKEGKPQLDFDVTCRGENGAQPSIFAEDKITLQMPTVEISGCPPRIDGTSYHGVETFQRNASCTCRLVKPGVPQGEVRWVDAKNITLISGGSEAVLKVGVKDHLMPFTCQALTLNAVVETIPFQPKFNVPPANPPAITVTYDDLITERIETSDLYAALGETLTFKCVVDGGIPSAGHVILGYGHEKVTANGTEASVKLTITKSHDQIEVSCRAEHDTDGYHHVTNFTLHIMVPAAIQTFSINGQSSQRIEVNAGAEVKFECLAEGNPPPKISLKGELTSALFNGQMTSEGVNRWKLSVTIASITMLDTDTITCRAENPVPKKKRSKRCAQNIVQSDTTKSSDLVVIGQPVITSSKDDPPYAWHKSGERVEGEIQVIAHPPPNAYTLKKITQGKDGIVTEVDIPSDQFTVDFVQVDCRTSVVKFTTKEDDVDYNNTRYHFTIGNGKGSPVNISLDTEVSIPALIKNYTTNGTEARKIEVNAGDEVKFECIAKGNPAPEITIKGYLTNVTLLGQVTSEGNYTWKRSVTIKSISVLDTDTYTCTAENPIPTKHGRQKRCADDIAQSDHSKSRDLIVIGAPAVTYMENDPPQATSSPDGKVFAEFGIVSNPPPKSYNVVKKTKDNFSGRVTKTQIPSSDYTLDFETINCRTTMVRFRTQDLDTKQGVTRWYIFTVDNGKDYPLNATLEIVKVSGPKVDESTDSDDASDLELGLIIASLLILLILIILVSIYLYWILKGKDRSDQRNSGSSRRGLLSALSNARRSPKVWPMDNGTSSSIPEKTDHFSDKRSISEGEASTEIELPPETESTPEADDSRTPQREPSLDIEHSSEMDDLPEVEAVPTLAPSNGLELQRRINPPPPLDQ